MVLEDKLPGFGKVQSQGKVFYTTPEAARAIQSHPYTIGYLPLNVALKSGLKVLRIDGQSPHEYVAQDTEYPFTVPFYLVYRENPAGAVRCFLDFLSGDKIKRRLQAEGVRPASW
ncbi:hypothetical protein A7E78_03965 [Syntrophotalea acetylenivorans]|uniref:PBP domain-containing protein n=1 Tax=Syntrophotalea acetylenivorans TaxID=1842532 RepID=A0A1L3GMA7_9BACT|nr:hypothetical protein [Syntrophotalea acetylenivorans]APG27062.1 hypothetical protein A7E78_03965 [Syntrophotalea acetylenivorans]